MVEHAHPVFPFFVGSGRSGTTLVQVIFSAHSQLAVTHESMFVPRLADRPYFASRVFQVDAFISDLQRLPDYRRLAVDGSELRARLVGSPPSDYAGAVRAVFAQYAAQHGKFRYGDKSPGYVLHIEKVASLLPEARFVHVVRDGRDVALSYLQRAFGPSDVPEAALYWQRRIRAGRNAGERLGPDRYIELRYEDLIASPAAVVRDLCPFLDLEFEASMLSYFEQGEELRAATADPSAHDALLLPPTKGLRDWRTQMTPSDLTLFESLAGRTLDQFGYERGGAEAGLAARISAAAKWTRWQKRRVTVASRSLLRRRGRRRSASS